MFSNLKIATKLMIVVITLGVCLAGLGSFSFMSAHRFESDLESILHYAGEELKSRDAIIQIQKLRKSVLSALYHGLPEYWEQSKKEKLASEELLRTFEKDADFDDVEFLKDSRDGIQRYEQITAKMRDAQSRGLGPNDSEMQTYLEEGADLSVKAETFLNNFSVAEKKESDEAAKQARDLTDSLIRWANISGIVSVILSIGSWLFLRNLLTRPLEKIVVVTEQLASGNLNVKVPNFKTNDEIGTLARALKVFQENLIKAEENALLNKQMLEKQNELVEKQQKDSELIQQRASQIQELEEKQKNALLQASAERKEFMQKMANVFEESVMEITKVVSSSTEEIHITAENVASNAHASSDRASKVYDKMEKSTTNIQTIASTAEELSVSVSEITEQVKQSVNATEKATTETINANKMMMALSQTTEKIGGVIQLINNIAGQTHLLALNATIEAARAGETGKGFSVVANEVKNLANQTAHATEEIRSQVTAVQEEANQAVSAIQKIGTLIQDVQSISASINGAVSQQELATQEIAKNIQIAANNFNNISESLEAATHDASTNGASAVQVLASVKELAQNTSRLTDEVTGFLKVIREDK